MYQKFIIPYVYEAQRISDDTPPIIRSLKLHWQLLLLHMWKVDGRCQTQYVADNIHHPHVHQPSTNEKPEAANAVLGS
jgi:hypothetical protein